MARIGYPHQLEEGRYLETFALLGLGWRISPWERLRLRILVRTGGLYLSGIGYDRNYEKWLPWVDAQISLAWQLGPTNLGFECGASPLQYTVSATDDEKRALPWLSIGVFFGIPIFSVNLK